MSVYKNNNKFNTSNIIKITGIYSNAFNIYNYNIFPLFFFFIISLFLFQF